MGPGARYQRSGDRDRDVPLLPDLQQLERGVRRVLRRCARPLRGELFGPAVQRRVPVRGLAPDGAAPAHRADHGDAASGGRGWPQDVDAGCLLGPDGREGYPGEIQDDPAGRWFYWTLSMIPFTFVLYELYFGLAEATKKHAPSVAALIASARYLTAISWLTYPFVYMVKGVGLGGSDATMAEQVGYSIADVTAKAVFGIVIWRIANEKTQILEEQSMLK